VPAAAVIPAPIAYIKVVAVKKLVVEPWNGAEGGGVSPLFPRSERRRSAPDGRALVRAFPPTGRSLLLLIEREYSPGLAKATGRPRPERARATPLGGPCIQGFAFGISERKKEKEGGDLSFFFFPLFRVSTPNGAPVRLP
jgi:hypothetical protein